MKKLAFVCGAVLVTMAPTFYEVQAEELYSIDYSETNVVKEEGAIFKDAQGVVYKIIMNQDGQREVQIGDGEKPIPGLGVDIVIPEEVEHEGNRYKVTKVASFAFTTYEDEAGNIAEGGSNVEDIQLPKTVRSIDDKAFYSSIYLRKVSIETGSELSYIGDHAFAFSSLTGFVLPDTVETIGKSAFTFNNQLVHFDISENAQLRTIGEGAFRTNPKLKKLYLPKEVTDIGDYPFSGAIGLRELEVSVDNEAYSSLNGVLFNKDQSTLIAYPADKDGASYVFPDTVKVIGKNAFEYNVNLRDIVLNDGVVDIGDLVFKNMLRAEKITLGSQIEHIGRLAFYNIENLEELVVPDSVYSYGKNPFYELNGLKKISLGAKTTDIKYGFLGGSFGNLQEIEFKNKEVVIRESAFMFFSNTNTEKITYLVASEAAKAQLIAELGVSEEMIQLVTEEPGTEEPGTEEPDTEEPGTEEPGTEEPSTEEPSTEEPGTEEPSTEELGTEEPGTEEPSTEEPGTEEPGTEEPGTEEPGTEEPSTEEPSTEEPSTEEPGTEEPSTEEPSTEEPGTEEPVTEEPSTEEPGTEEPGTEEPGTEEPGTEESSPEEPGTEEPGTEEPGTEEPGTEEPVTEEPSTEEPGTEEPGTEEPGTEEPGTEEPSTEEPSIEEPGTKEPSTEEPGTEEPSTEELDKEQPIVEDKPIVNIDTEGAKDVTKKQPSVSVVAKKERVADHTPARLPQTNDKKMTFLSYLGSVVLSGTYLAFRRKR